MRIGELIAIARECKGWTLRDLEKASGVSNSLISQIELGRVKDPSFCKVVQILDALGVSLDRAAVDIRARSADRIATLIRQLAEAREEIETLKQNRICGACGVAWQDGMTCAQKDNGWPFPTCYPAPSRDALSQTAALGTTEK